MKLVKEFRQSCCWWGNVWFTRWLSAKVMNEFSALQQSVHYNDAQCWQLVSTPPCWCQWRHAVTCSWQSPLGNNDAWCTNDASSEWERKADYDWKETVEFNIRVKQWCEARDETWSNIWAVARGWITNVLGTWSEAFDTDYKEMGVSSQEMLIVIRMRSKSAALGWMDVTISHFVLFSFSCVVILFPCSLFL